MKKYISHRYNTLLLFSLGVTVFELLACTSVEPNPTAYIQADTIPSSKFEDNYAALHSIDDIYKKPYDLVFLWGTIEIANLNGRVIKTIPEQSYSLSFTTTKESIPRDVLIYKVNSSKDGITRTYFLNNLNEEKDIPISEQFAEGFEETAQMSIWDAYRYQLSETSNQIEKIKVNMIIHSKKNEIYMIQIAEPFKNIYSYMP